MKAYEKLGLTSSDVIEIQKWMYPMVDNTATISEMITNVVQRYEGAKLHYALYILGNNMGQAQIEEQLGIKHILNPEEI